MNDKEELERRIAYLEAKYAGMRRRYESQRAKVDSVYRHPLRFAVGRWYHKYIKRDQIV